MMMISDMLPCPFCGGKAELSCRYDSDDNRPDGYQWFIQCGDCGSKGAEFYAEDVAEYFLNDGQRKQQAEENFMARKNALDAWNRRVQ